MSLEIEEVKLLPADKKLIRTVTLKRKTKFKVKITKIKSLKYLKKE